MLQTTYLKVLEGRAVYHGDSSFKTWLFAVIRRTASEERRRRLVRAAALLRWRSTAGQAAPPAVQLRDAQDELLLSERNAELVAALGSLPRRQREVLQLVFYHDLTIAEAAGVLHIALGTARRHYERGKRALRATLEGKLD